MKATIIKSFWVSMGLLQSVQVLAGEGGGSGVRGGVGVQCKFAPEKTVVLEDFMLYQMHTPEGMIDSQKLLSNLPEKYENIKQRILAQYRFFGAIETWPGSVESDDQGIVLSLQNKLTIEHPFRKLLTYLREFRLFDENIEITLPEGCRIVQLALAPRSALFFRNQMKPFLLPEGQRLTSKRQRDLLRLHEAIYAVGDELFGHKSSFLTRQLLVALIRKDAALIAKAMVEFVESERSILDFKSKHPLFSQLVESPMVFGLDRSMGLNACYKNVVLEYASGDSVIAHYVDPTQRLFTTKFKTIEDFLEELNSSQECLYERI